MTFNPDNFKKEEDPILNLPTEDGLSVKDSLQNIRDEHAKTLRNMRQERDEKRKEGKSEEANELQNRAMNKKNILSKIVRPKQNQEVLDNAIGKVFESFENLSLGIYDNDPNKFQQILEGISKDDVERLLNSDYKNSSVGVLLRMQRIGDTLKQRGLGMYSNEKQYSGFVQDMLTRGSQGEGKMYKNEEALGLLGNISYDIDLEDKERIRKQVDKNIDETKVTKLFYQGEQGKMTIESLIGIGSTVTTELISGIVKEAIKPDANLNMQNTLSSLGFEYEDRAETTKLITEIVGKNLEEEFNIKNGYAVAKRWQGGISMGVEINLFSLRNIAKERPGGVKLLNENYGICEISRYPKEMMVDQIDNHDKDVPYGAVFFPAEDHNDAFDQDREVLKQLYDGTKGKHISRVFEVAEKSSLARFLVTLRAKYEHKIDFMILAAHGEEYGMEFSWKSRLNKDIVSKSTSIEAIKEMMIDEPSIVLFSCSTGAEKGFAQVLSEKLSARVQAPTVTSGPESLSVRYEGDKPIIDVKFRNDQREYLRGI